MKESLSEEEGSQIEVDNPVQTPLQIQMEGPMKQERSFGWLSSLAAFQVLLG